MNLLAEGDDFTNLEKRGIIIGVADGKLEEYVRLHDETATDYS